MIKSIVIIAYIYGLLPLLIGTASTLLGRHHISFTHVYVTGYVIYLSLFDIMTIWGIHNHASFSHFSKYWKATILMLTILVLVIISISIITIWRKHKLHKRLFPGLNRESSILLGVTVLLTLLAVLLLVPHPLDETPELARMSLATDSFFSHNPSTGAPYTYSSSVPGYLHLFYVLGSSITGINATTLIHLIMPIFMIPLFVCIYVMIARILYPDEERIRDRFRFVCLIILFYLLMLPLEAHVAFAPYRNIWNGITLAASCFFPLFIAVCLDLTRHFSVGQSETVLLIPNAVMGLIILALTIRLCIPYGIVLCGLFVFASIVIILVKVLWQKRFGSDSTHSTKGGEQS